MTITVASSEHILRIKQLLLEWTTEKEASDYLTHINQSIKDTSTAFHCYTVKDEEGIVGIGAYTANHQPFLAYGNPDTTAIVDILYLDRSTRGKGYGSALLDFLRNNAKSNGYQTILAKSAGTQCPAYDFFGHKGFLIVGQERTPELIIVFSAFL